MSPFDSGGQPVQASIAPSPAASVAAAVLAGVAAIGGGVALGSGALECSLLAARYTARVSFVFFLAAYATTPGARRFVREPFALAFTVAHVIHLGAIVTYFSILGELPAPAALAVGGAGYVVLLAMAGTAGTPDRPAVARLNAVGPHYLWFVFFASYAGRLAEGNPFWSSFLGLLVVSLAIRLFRGGRPRRAALAAGS